MNIECLVVVLGAHAADISHGRTYSQMTSQNQPNHELSNPIAPSSPKPIVSSRNRNGDNYSKSAPTSAGSRLSDNEWDSAEDRPLLGRSLVKPILEESDVFSSSESSTLQRHKQAAEGALGEFRRNHDKSDLEDSWVEILERNEHKREDHGTTDLQTFIHMLKGNIGTGLLALPYLVQNAGLIVGAVGLVIMGIIATHCMGILVDTSHRLSEKRKTQALNYAEVARFAILEHTRKQLVSKIGFWVVNVFLIITQFGFCAAYFVFMGDNINQVVCLAFGPLIGYRAWIAILLPLVIIFCWIRNLDELTPFSMIANLCILFSLAVILYEEIYQLFLSNDPQEMAAVRTTALYLGPASITTLAFYFGGVMFSFEGIGVVLPLENKMKKPQNSKRVIYGGMVVVTVLYVFFSTLGYLVYGNNIAGSITLNLASDRLGPHVLFLIVKLYYSYAIFATYMVQFYVPMDFLEPPLYNRFHYRFPRHKAKVQFIIQLVFRTIMVVVTAGIALAIPNLGDLVSLVGAVASTSLALSFPPLLDILVFWKENKRFYPFPVWFTKDILIILLGVIGSVIATYASLSKIISGSETNIPLVCYPNYSI